MRWSIVRGSMTALLILLSLGLVACGSSGDSADAQSEATAAPSTALAAGDTVAATWTDGSLYLAKVTAVDGDQVTVTYVDDGTSGTVAASKVRQIPETTFAVGDRVLAVWSKGRFYPGEITKVEGTTYTVKWDDGSDPSGVEAGAIIAE